MRQEAIHVGRFLGIAACAVLAASLAGCGGATEMDQAVVTSAPEADLPARPPVPNKPRPAPAEAPAPKTGETAAPSTAGGSPGPSARAVGWGTLKGRVVYGGTPPQQPVLQAAGKAVQNPEVCARTAPILDERLVVNPSNKGVANAFVYLQRPSSINEDAKKRASSRPAEFDQKNCTFLPHALAVMVGTPIHLKSSDPVNHNVNIGLRELNQNPSMPAGSTLTITPDTAERGPGRVTCNIHPWMTAFWLILDHPYFAVTDKDGNFEIKNVPSGDQKVVVWQEAARYLTPTAGESVAIPPDGTTTKEFTIDPAKLAPAG